MSTPMNVAHRTPNNTANAAPKKGVASIIAGLNRKTPVQPNTTTVTMNPLLMKQTKPNQPREERSNTENKVNTSPKVSRQNLTSPKASQLTSLSALDKKIISPKSQNSKIQAGSPLRQPRSPLQQRSPLSPRDSSNSTTNSSTSLTSPLRSNFSSNKRKLIEKSTIKSQEEINNNQISINEIEKLTLRNSLTNFNHSSPKTSRISQIQTIFSSPNSPSKLTNQQKTIRTATVLNIRTSKPQFDDLLLTPADPTTPTHSGNNLTFDTPSVSRKTIEIASLSNYTSSSSSSTHRSCEENSDFAILFDKIKKQSKRQFELALYQMIELFTKNQQYRRNPIVLHSLITFKASQLVQFMMEYLSPNRSLDDRRNVADTLSSLLSLHGKFPREVAAISELLKSNHSIQVFMECMKDDDWLLRSYTVGVLAMLNIDPNTYLAVSESAMVIETSNQPINGGNVTSRDSFSTSSNPLFAISSNTPSTPLNNSAVGRLNRVISFRDRGNQTPLRDTSSNPLLTPSNHSSNHSICGQNDWVNAKESVEKISRLLESKTAEVREMAMSSMICLGPLAGSLLPDLSEILLKDKCSNLRILACKTIEEIGLPYCLPMMDILNEVVKKDKDENVRKFAFKVYENLFMKNSQFPIPSVTLSRPEKKIVINKTFLKDLFIKNNVNGSGNTFKGLSFADISKYIEKQYPNIDKESPSWRSQLKITVKRMIEENSATKIPAVYSFTF